MAGAMILLLAFLSTLTLTLAEATHTLQVYAWPFSSTPTSLASIEYTHPSLNTTILSAPSSDLLTTLSSQQSNPSDPLSSHIRLGFFTPSTSRLEKDWTGILTPLTSLSPSRAQKLVLHLDPCLDGSISALTLTAQDIRPLTKEEEKERKKVEREAKRAARAAAAAAESGEAGGAKKAPPSRSAASAKVANKGANGAKAISPAADALPTEPGFSAIVIAPNEGPKPVLNKPVVVNKETGKPAGEGEKEEEKSFFQKYWWALGIFLVVQLFISPGGGDSK